MDDSIVTQDYIRVRHNIRSPEFDNYMQKIDRYAVFVQYWTLLSAALFIWLMVDSSIVTIVLISLVFVAFLVFHILMFRNTILMLYDRTEAIVDMVATFIPFVGFIVVLYNLDECKNKIMKEGYTFKFGRLHNYR